MRCPKCQYISFDSGDRCRNCGYEFSLSVEDESRLDVTIRREAPSPGRIHADALDALNTPLTRRDPEAGPGEEPPLRAPRPLPTADDLPLFTSRVADDQAPLITPSAVPRAPLSVRRATPSGRGRARAADSSDLPLEPAGTDEDAAARPRRDEAADAFPDAASAGRRLLAGLVDSAILLAICAAVVLLTLRVSDLPASQWQVLPVMPLAAFLLLLCGGYFVLFTAAGGQTIGKMLLGIRVVAASSGPAAHPRVSFGAAMKRTVACLGSVAALGAGFVPILLRPDRRAFHDQISDTRVVSA